MVNDYAFVVSESSGHGIQAFDLTRLRNTPLVCAPDYVIGGALGSCHNIIANEATSKIFAVGCDSGTHCANNGMAGFIINGVAAFIR